MDKKLLKIANEVEKTNERIRMTLVLDGLLFHGWLVSSATFRAETEKSFGLVGDTVSAELTRRFFKDDNYTSKGMLHLFDVAIIPGSQAVTPDSSPLQVAFPSLRVEIARVTAWIFGGVITYYEPVHGIDIPGGHH